MIKLSATKKPLHRTWIRLLPYTGFGALLIFLTSAESIQSTWIIYFILMFAQLGVVGIYLLTTQLLKRKENAKSNKI